MYETVRYYVGIRSDSAWEVVIEAHLTTESVRPTAGVLHTFEGKGSSKTRPFSVPSGIEYFVVRWSSSDDDMDITVGGVDPTSCYEDLSNGRTGEGLVYETGRFYIEVHAEGRWKVDVLIE